MAKWAGALHFLADSVSECQYPRERARVGNGRIPMLCLLSFNRVETRGMKMVVEVVGVCGGSGDEGG